MSAGVPNGLDGLTEEIQSLKSRLFTSRRNNSVLSFGIVICLVGFMLAVLGYVHKPNKYFAFTPNMQLMNMPPLDEPTYNDSDVGTWVTGVVCRTMSINFKQWEIQLERVRTYYSPGAFKELVADLKGNGNLKRIVKDRLIAHVTPTQAAVLTAKGELQNLFTWKYEIPLLVSLESSDGVESTENWLGTVLVQRASPLEHPEGIRIIQLNVGPR